MSGTKRARVFSKPLRLALYCIAVAIFAVATVRFGEAGAIAGIALIVLVKVGFWAAPLVKLSYSEPKPEPKPKP